MENHPEGVPSPRPHAAHAMAKVDSVVAPGALDRAAVDGEHDRIALMQWHDRGPRLHTGTLFRQERQQAEEVPRANCCVKVVRLKGKYVRSPASRPPSRCGPSSGKHPNIRTSEHYIFSCPLLSVRMFGSWGKKRANASSNCAAL